MQVLAMRVKTLRFGEQDVLFSLGTGFVVPMGTDCEFCALRQRSNHHETAESQPQGRTLVDHVLNVVCLLTGFQVHGKEKPWQGFLRKFVWLCVSVVYLWLSFERSLKTVANSSGPASLIAVTLHLNECLYALTTVYVTFVFIDRRECVATLMQKNGRRLRDFFIPLSSVMPFYILEIFFTGDSCVQCVLFRASSVYAMTIMSRFFLIYTDILENFRRLHQDILNIVQGLGVPGNRRSGSLVEKKWRLRELLQKTNSLFAWILAAYYIQMVLTTVVGLSSIFGTVSRFNSGALLLLGLALLVLQFCVLAMKSSTCIRLNQEAENVISKKSDSCSSICSRCQEKHLRLLRYREEWDSLKVACFTHGVPNLLSYAVTCVTCVAVLLQFDFRVVESLSKLATEGR